MTPQQHLLSREGWNRWRWRRASGLHDLCLKRLASAVAVLFQPRAGLLLTQLRLVAAQGLLDIVREQDALPALRDQHSFSRSGVEDPVRELTRCVCHFTTPPSESGTGCCSSR